jgi:hypothetical protein
MGLAVDTGYKIEDEQINKIKIKIKSKFLFVIDPSSQFNIRYHRTYHYQKIQDNTKVSLILSHYPIRSFLGVFL